MKFLKNNRIKREGKVYFVNKGEKCGLFLYVLLFDKTNKLYSVLTLPDCEPIFISESEIEKYIIEKIIEHVDTPPKKILKETILEFNFRKDHNKK